MEHLRLETAGSSALSACALSPSCGAGEGSARARGINERRGGMGAGLRHAAAAEEAILVRERCRGVAHRPAAASAAPHGNLGQGGQGGPSRRRDGVSSSLALSELVGTMMTESSMT